MKSTVSQSSSYEWSPIRISPPLTSIFSPSHAYLASGLVNTAGGKCMTNTRPFCVPMANDLPCVSLHDLEMKVGSLDSLLLVTESSTHPSAQKWMESA